MWAGLLTLRTGVLVATLCALAGSGWIARGWYEDAQRLTVHQAATQAIEAAQARESSIAEQVEQRLAQQVVRERVIDRGIIREIQKPIYRRVCAQPAAVRLLNAAAAGLSADPAQLDAAMSGDTAGAE